jgi:hypothetical protein
MLCFFLYLCPALLLRWERYLLFKADAIIIAIS